MEVTYRLTQRDFYESFIAHRNRTRLQRWAFRIIFAIALLLAVSGMLLLILRPTKEVIQNLKPLFGMAAFYVVLIWGLPWWSARVQYKKQPAVQVPRTMLINNDAVDWKWDGGSAHIEWNNFTRWLESKSQFLLYTSPACLNMIPKRELTPEQISEMRSWFEQHVKQQG